jgi:hypothetical protein
MTCCARFLTRLWLHLLLSTDEAETHDLLVNNYHLGTVHNKARRASWC